MNHPLTALLVTCSVIAVACGGSPKPTPAPPATPAADPTPAKDDGEPDAAAICDRVSDHVLAVMTQELEKDLAKMPPEQADKIRAELATAMSKPELVGRCLAAPPSADEFLCITNAESVAALIACDRSQKGPDRESCVTVTDHILPLLVAEEKLFVDDTDEVRTQKLAGLSQDLITACLERNFTAAEVQCILGASSLAQVSECEQPAPTAP